MSLRVLESRSRSASLVSQVPGGKLCTRLRLSRARCAASCIPGDIGEALGDMGLIANRGDIGEATPWSADGTKAGRGDVGAAKLLGLAKCMPLGLGDIGEGPPLANFSLGDNGEATLPEDMCMPMGLGESGEASRRPLGLHACCGGP